MAKKFDPDWRVSPGEVLKEWMYEHRIHKISEVAEMANMQRTHVRDILWGQATVTSAVAQSLAEVTGTTANFWINLEAEYRRPVTRHG